MSASTSPTLRPARASATARLAVKRRLADPALARADRDQARPLRLVGHHRHAHLGDAWRARQAPSLDRRSRAARARAASSAGDVEHQRGDAVGQPQRLQRAPRRWRQAAGARAVPSAVARPAQSSAPRSRSRPCGRAPSREKADGRPCFCADAVPISCGMETIGEWDRARSGLAMAGRRSPWGGGDKGGIRRGDATSAATPAGDGAARADAAATRAPRGPRNPWLPRGDDAAAAPLGQHRGHLQHRGPRPRRRRRRRRRLSRLPAAPRRQELVPAHRRRRRRWSGCSSPPSTRSAPRKQGIVTTFGKYSRTLEPGRLVHAALADPERRRRGRHLDPPRHASPRATAREADADRRPEPGRPQLPGPLEHQGPEAVQVPARRARRDGARSRRGGDARLGRRNARSTDVLSGAGRAEIEQNVRQRMQAILDAYRSGIADPGRRDQEDRPARARWSRRSRTSPPRSRTPQRDVNRAEA